VSSSMHPRLLGVVLLGAWVGWGCASQESVLRTRVSREAECPESQVQITDLGGGAYKASGCGFSGTFICRYGGASGQPALCVKEGTTPPGDSGSGK